MFGGKAPKKEASEPVFKHGINTNPVMPEPDEEDCFAALKEIEIQRSKWNSFLRNRKDIWTEKWLWDGKIRAEAASNQIKKKFLQIFSSKVKTQKQVKFLIRGGVPPELRGNVWWACSGAGGKMAEAGPEDQYSVLLTRIDALNGTSMANDIEKDLLRTFPERINAGNSSTVDSLRRVLRAYALRNKEVGYCQSMNYLCALLLFHMSEEQSFWVLAALVEDILPNNYYAPSLLGGRVDQQVFQSCIAWKLPKLFSQFKATSTLLEPIICPWFLCLYINVLPLSVVCRVWDCMFWEGNVVLFRIGLTMMKSKTKYILDATDFISIYQVLKVSNSKTYSFELESRDASTSGPTTPTSSSMTGPPPPPLGGLDLLQDFGSISRAEHLINSAFGFRWLKSVPKAKVEILRDKFLHLLEGDRAERALSGKASDPELITSLKNSGSAGSTHSPTGSMSSRFSGLFRTASQTNPGEASGSSTSPAGSPGGRAGAGGKSVAFENPALGGGANRHRPLPATTGSTTEGEKSSNEAAELAAAISKHKSTNKSDVPRARTRQSLAMLRLLEDLEYVFPTFL